MVLSIKVEPYWSVKNTALNPFNAGSLIKVEPYWKYIEMCIRDRGNTIPDSEESIAGNRNSNNQTDSGYRPPRNAGVGSYEMCIRDRRRCLSSPGWKA